LKLVIFLHWSEEVTMDDIIFLHLSNCPYVFERSQLTSSSIFRSFGLTVNARKLTYKRLKFLDFALFQGS